MLIWIVARRRIQYFLLNGLEFSTPLAVSTSESDCKSLNNLGTKLNKNHLILSEEHY